MCNLVICFFERKCCWKNKQVCKWCITIISVDVKLCLKIPEAYLAMDKLEHWAWLGIWVCVCVCVWAWIHWCVSVSAQVCVWVNVGRGVRVCVHVFGVYTMNGSIILSSWQSLQYAGIACLIHLSFFRADFFSSNLVQSFPTVLCWLAYCQLHKMLAPKVVYCTYLIMAHEVNVCYAWSVLNSGTLGICKLRVHYLLIFI